MKYVHIQLSQAQDLADYLESKVAMDAPIGFEFDSLFSKKLNQCIQAIIQINLYYQDEECVIDNLDISDIYDDHMKALGYKFAVALFEKYTYVINNGYTPTYSVPLIVSSYGNIILEVE